MASSIKLRAATLLEVLLSMIIICLVFIIGTTIFLAVQKRQSQMNYIKVNGLRDKVMGNIESWESLKDSTIYLQGYKLIIRNKQFQQSNNLVSTELEFYKAEVLVNKQRILHSK